MATTFNDSNAWIDSGGNFSLGNAGRGDGTADATHTYAKGDCFVNVPIIPGAFTSVTQALTFARTSAGIYTAALAAAASTGIVIVPITGIFRKFSGQSGGPTNPHGFKLTDFVIGYTIATASETSITPAFFTEVQTNNVARASVATPFGAVTVENPIGTVVANLPVAAQAAPYVARVVPAAPIFVNADNTDVWLEISFVNPGTSVATITHLGYHCSVALY